MSERRAGHQARVRVCVRHFHDSVGRPCFRRARCLQTESASSKRSSATTAAATADATAAAVQTLLLNGTEGRKCIFFSGVSETGSGFFFIFKGPQGTSQSCHKPPDELAAGLAQQQICKVMQ